MTAPMAAGLAAQGVLMAFYLLLPVAVGALVAALAVGAFQSAVQLQDSTISFLPKLLLGGAALLLFGPWMLSMATTFARGAWALIAHIAR
jgi:flagellar biosynthetic protein FliQ